MNYFIKGYKKEIRSNELEQIKSQKELSIIIPTYNEERNILLLVKEIRKILENFRINYEILVVDDNSKDNTPQIINKLARGENFLALHRYSNRGLFNSIKDGVKIANGVWVITMDSDFSHPPKVIPNMLKYKDKFDIVSASRFVKGGKMKVSLVHNLGARAINFLCSKIISIPIKDLGGEFRLFKKEDFLELKLQLPSAFGEYSFEFFYKALKNRYKIKEIPFTYEEREKGKSKMGNQIKTAGIYLKRAFELRTQKDF